MTRISDEEWQRRVNDASARQAQLKQQEEMKKFNSQESAKAAAEARNLFRR